MAEQVVTINSDVLSGQINMIGDSESFIKPDYADEFATNMAAVESIDSKAFFEPEMADGKEIFAGFFGRADRRRILAADDEELEVDMADALEATESDPSYDRV